ncbi:MAG: copper amine oxidase N-terminal domain-containing protein [Clostridia bacterium]
MKHAKQIGSAVLMAVLLTGSLTLPTVYAESALHPAGIQNDPPPPPITLQINGEVLDPEETVIYEDEHEHYMLPLRQAAEKLGYTLKWNQEKRMLELTKGQRFIMLQIGKDQYNINKMAVTLGDAPKLQNGKTYVPLAFFSEILKENVVVNDRFHLSITGGDADPAVHIAPVKEGTITDVVQGKEGFFVTINGFANGIRLGINDKTEIVTVDGKKLTVDDLKPGMTISATVGPAMTLSIPPQAMATKIIVTETGAELLGTEGAITQITTLPDGTKTVVIEKGVALGGKGFESVVLKLSDKTELFSTLDNSKVKADQLKEGQTIIAFYGPMVTKSLPPQAQAVKILVNVQQEPVQ